MTTYLEPKQFDTERFYGEHLQLANHDAKILVDFGKILGGGAFEEQRLNAPRAHDLPDQIIRDAFSFFLIQSVGDSIEFVISNNQRWIELVESGYENISVSSLVAIYIDKNWNGF